MKTATLLIFTFILFTFNSNALSLRKEKFETLRIDYTKTDVSCFGKTDGNIQIQISGGKAPFIIIWDNGVSSLELNDLRNGQYTVKVCDARGKTATEIINIETPEQLQLRIDITSATFIDAVNGEMNAQIVGGTPWEIENTNYYFTKINNQSFYENPKSLLDGEYTFSIEDAHACVYHKSILIDFELSSSRGQELDNSINPNKSVVKITIIDKPFAVNSYQADFSGQTLSSVLTPYK